MTVPDVDLARHYYLDLAAAYVRGAIRDAPKGSPAELLRVGLDAGLTMHRFKRSAELPRVRRVLGTLFALQPSSLLDIGSGRGAFLWPLLDTFPELPVTSVDRLPDRIDAIRAVAAGGIDRLAAAVGDVTALDFADGAFDVVTVLEVLEHLPNPDAAVDEILRVARRFVVASVPSRPDENPEHLRLYTAETLRALFARGRVRSVRCDFVLNHIVALVVLAER